MTCDEALDRMLEVDPGDLTPGPTGTAGGDEGELAMHVAGCVRCAAVARALRSELRSLDAGLGALAGRPAATDRIAPEGADPARSVAAPIAAKTAANAAADAAAEAVLAALRAGGEPDDPSVPPGTRPRYAAGMPPHDARTDDGPKSGIGRRNPWIRRAWIPLAAAAALAGVFLVGRQPPPLPPSETATTTETIDPRVSVMPPADRGAAILETENPNITIVWLYEREES